MKARALCVGRREGCAFGVREIFAGPRDKDLFRFGYVSTMPVAARYALQTGPWRGSRPGAGAIGRLLGAGPVLPPTQVVCLHVANNAMPPARFAEKSPATRHPLRLLRARRA